MSDYSKMTCRVIDNGLSVSVAERLARQPVGFGRVEYFCPYVSAFTSPNLAKIGTGFPGVTRIEKFFEPSMDDVDLFVFLDVGFGDFQEYLRRNGHLVFGCGDGEEMELYRWHARLMYEQLGMATVPATLVTGIDALREHLKKHKNVWVKVSKYRGIGETWKSINYELSKARLDLMQAKLGPLADEQEWIVEEEIKTTREIGYDGPAILGQYPPTSLGGIEKKDCGYLIAAMPYKDLPEGVRLVNDCMAPAFKQYGYRGLYSSEIREGEDGKRYLIDNTCRYPSPPGELMQEMIINLPDVFYKGAKGELVDIQTDHAYGFELILYSDFAPKNPQAIQYPKEIARNVKLYNSIRRKGTDWVLPTEGELEQIGGVTGFGSTIDEAIKQAEKHADMVKGDRVTVKSDLVPTMLKLLRENAKKGIRFGKSAIPD